MNENVGASFGLSVLVVVFFAVALYQRDTPAVAEKAKPPTDGAHPNGASSPPAATQDSPAVTAVPPSARAIRQPGHVPDAPSIAARPKPVAKRAESMSATVAVVSERRAAPAEKRPKSPGSAFTEAKVGETLADVALRVYGSPDAIESLRKANRDLLRDDESPLVAGALIRTP